MHYIRFLKTPRVSASRGKVSLKSVISITTDLGETTYPDDVELVATLRDLDQDGDIYLRRRFQWTAGSLTANINFDLSNQDVEWPACVHVSVKNHEVSNGFLPPIMDVWSGEMTPTRGLMDAGRRVERRFTSLNGRVLNLLEDAGDSIARHLWDGSQALAQYLDQMIALQTASPILLLEYVLTSATYRRLNVLELGCGCGTVGIGLAQTIPDADLLLTDLPEAEELVEDNIRRMKPAISSKVVFESLDWEQPLPTKLQSRTNDLIMVSECTYNSDTLQALVSTLFSLTVRSPKAVILVATKTRHSSEAEFFRMMKDAGLVEDSSTRVPLPGIAGTGYADWATDVGLHVFRGKGHRLSLSPRESSSEVPRSRRRSANTGGSQ